MSLLNWVGTVGPVGKKEGEKVGKKKRVKKGVKSG